MFDRIARSWNIAGECLRILMEDKSLLIFPILSGIALSVLAVSFGLPIWLAMHAGHFAAGTFGMAHRGQFLLWLLLYLVSYSVSTFFNTALVFVALRRMNGQDAGLSEGIHAALQRLPAILGYCLIAATFGMLLRAIEERVGFIGSIIAGLIGFTFSVATTLVVPVLAASDLGPIDAIQESVAMMKRTWGENIIGNAGISIMMGLATVLVVLAGGALFIIGVSSGSAAVALLLGAIAVLGFVTVMAVGATLHAIYNAALYHYASGSTGGPYFDGDLLGSAYRVR